MNTVKKYYVAGFYVDVKEGETKVYVFGRESMALESLKNVGEKESVWFHAIPDVYGFHPKEKAEITEEEYIKHVEKETGLTIKWGQTNNDGCWFYTVPKSLD